MAIAEHADELLGGVFDVGIADEVDAALHDVGMVLGIDDGNGLETLFAHDGALAEQGDVVRLASQAEEQVDGVHLDLHLILIVGARYQPVEGTASLGASTWQGEVVALQFFEGDAVV